MASSIGRRRLAAIVAVDMVGYSRLMESNEATALSHLKTLHEDVLQPRVAEFGGRIVKTMGDGALAEFGSAVEAVQAAVAIQEDVAAADDGAEEACLRVRIGVNLGDVVVDGDDLYGDGINVAARLESIARPGEILIASAVYGVVRTALNFDFVDRGPKNLKNIAEPVRIYALDPAGVAREPAALENHDTTQASERPALAVLPFNNIGGDPEQEYFADGLTEDIITALSHWRLIPVIARNSTFTYKGQSVPAQRVAAELGARYVLEGSVRRAAQRLRITVQLVDAGTGHHVWAEKFDRRIDEIDLRPFSHPRDG
ncbi:MAG: adenylate/guanylate cyclase domain-containing protein [Pseudomonadota bacterium]